jgi:DNA-binding CsgD family transcriptional regulator/tetratricopeptide (TPR) repeat protein
MGALAVEQVAQRLDVSLDVLSGANRMATARQQTLRATIDWSHKLLSEAERTLFRRLSLFAGGWTLEAAERVCSGGGVEENDVLDLLGGLVDKSLVAAGAPTGGAVRYRMLEPLRQYAREKLEEGGEADEVHNRHAAFFLAVAEEAEPELAGPQQSVWLERLEREHDNLREALSWALQREAELALRLSTALWRFWHTLGYLSEGVRWLDRAIADSKQAADPARVSALEGMGWLTQRQGDTQRAKATYEAMLELSRRLGEKTNIATALNSLGTLAVAEGDNERARSLLEENLAVLRELENEGDAATPLKKFYVFNLLGALAINEEDDYPRGAALWEAGLALARETGDVNAVGSTLSNLGYAELLQGEYEQARTLSEEALTLARDLGAGRTGFIPETLVNLGLAAREQGYHERADACFEEALVVSQQAGTKPSVINTLEGMAGLAGAVKEDIRAARLWGAAEAAREVTGVALPPPERALHEPHLAAARSRLGETTWEEGLAEGRAMSLEVAAEYVLSEEPDHSEATIEQDLSTRDEPMGNLTQREGEVMVLVARGHTNRQISRELGISERTAGNHIAKILKKLGLRSRTQIASWASESQSPMSRPD